MRTRVDIVLEHFMHGLCVSLRAAVSAIKLIMLIHSDVNVLHADDEHAGANMAASWLTILSDFYIAR